MPVFPLINSLDFIAHSTQPERSIRGKCAENESIPALLAQVFRQIGFYFSSLDSHESKVAITPQFLHWFRFLGTLLSLYQSDTSFVPRLRVFGLIDRQTKSTERTLGIFEFSF